MSNPGKWTDISMPLRHNMAHWPEDPPVQIQRIMDMGRGEKCNVTSINCTVHAGTHIDAPVHFVANGRGIDEMPVDELIGPTRIVPVENTRHITSEDVEKSAIQTGERILFRTCNSERCHWHPDFVEDYVYISSGAAEALARIKPKCVGIDYLSVGGWPDGGIEAHQAMLEAGIWLIEGLDLSKTPPGNYEMICLPLRIVGADGAFARAIVRPLHG